MRCIQGIEAQMIPQDQIGAMFNMFNQVIETQRALGDQLTEIFVITKKDMDEQDQEEMEGHLEELTKLTSYVMEIVGHLMMIYGAEIENFIIESMLPKFGAIFQKQNAMETELVDALCFTCDVLEYGGEKLFALVQPNASSVFMSLLPKYRDNDDTQILQSIMYGYGIMASKMSNDSYRPVLDTVMQLCDEGIKHPEATEDRIVYTETVYGVLGKLCYTQISEPTLATKFVSLLPLKNEKEEANKCHKLFF